jgi:ferredoxin
VSRDRHDDGEVLVVDWIACDGYGLCGDLAPDLVTLDRWSYPIVPDGPVPRALLDDARRIVDCCPMKALALRKPARRRLAVASDDPRARAATKAVQVR